MNLIEISEYQSNLINVNRAYKGSPISIMSAITEEYLGKSISQHTSADTFQDKMKMIIAHPIIHDRDNMEKFLVYFLVNFDFSVKVHTIDLKIP